MNLKHINDRQVEILCAALGIEPEENLMKRIVDFCSPAERGHWEITERFAHLPDSDVISATLSALRDGKLLRRAEPAGWVYRAAFPGVDIDAIHHKRSKSHA